MTAAGDWIEWAQYVLSEIKSLNTELKSLCEDVSSQSDSIAKNHEAWSEHLRRLESAEKDVNSLIVRLDIMEKFFTSVKEQQLQIATIQEYKLKTIKVVIKLFSILGAVVGAAYTAWETIRHFVYKN